MKLSGSLALLLLLVCCFACEPNPPSASTTPDPYAHISDSDARTLLQRAIARAGGLDAWRNLRGLHFKKYVALYDSAGNIESESLQNHDYTYRADQSIRISWMDEGVSHRIIYHDEKVIKKENAWVDTTTSRESLLNTVRSATFVISIPFKLLDEGARLSYAGLDTLEDNRVVEVLRATYDPAEYEQHTTPDTWWHYFDANDYTQVGYLVQHADHYSYVRNLEFTRTDSLLFPTVRESYRVDSLQNKLYTRAKYRYTDYEVKFR